jgi:hypothetical protein
MTRKETHYGTSKPAGAAAVLSMVARPCAAPVRATPPGLSERNTSHDPGLGPYSGAIFRHGRLREDCFFFHVKLAFEAGDGYERHPAAGNMAIWGFVDPVFSVSSPMSTLHWIWTALGG